jgi:hypothetical protein
MMTEEKWQAGTDPVDMVDFLRGKASDRKFRLFAVACCQRIWHLLDDDAGRDAVEVAERYAAGRSSPLELAAACEAASQVAVESFEQFEDWNCTDGRAIPPQSDALYAAALAAEGRAEPLGPEEGWVGSHWYALTALRLEGRSDASEERWQAALAREIFGNPFRPIVMDPRWQTTKVRLSADAIYRDKAFDRLPALAEALEDAGCRNEALLGHCRSGAEHVRGCWVVDLILGRG